MLVSKVDLPGRLNPRPAPRPGYGPWFFPVKSASDGTRDLELKWEICDLASSGINPPPIEPRLGVSEECPFHV